MPHLPPSAPGQTFVTVSPIAAGFLTLPDKAFVYPADDTSKRTVPSLCFLITHPGSSFVTNPDDGTPRRPLRMMFDLGLRSDPDRYIAPQRQHLDMRQPYRLSSVAEHLERGGVPVEEIGAVLLSHVHYDHHGDPGDFPNASFLVGSGAMDLLHHGLTGKGSHQFFDADLFSGCRVEELPPVNSRPSGDDERGWEWKPLGPFPAALDLLADGSVYVIDAPGHLPGHVNLLCRTGDESWVCLAGDSFHDPRLLTGEKEIGTWEDAAGNTICIHLDREEAGKTIERLRALERMDGVRIVAAHDSELYERNKENMFPGTL